MLFHQTPQAILFFGPFFLYTVSLHSVLIQFRPPSIISSCYDDPCTHTLSRRFAHCNQTSQHLANFPSRQLQHYSHDDYDYDDYTTFFTSPIAVLYTRPLPCPPSRCISMHTFKDRLKTQSHHPISQRINVFFTRHLNS